jgi:PAS domain S-box-containing protein
MAERSKHEKTDGGRQAKPAYERLHPDGRKPPGDPEPSGAAAQPGVVRTRETLFAHLFELSSDGVVLHELLPPPAMARCLDVNERMCRILGYGREQMLKLDPLDMLDDHGRKAMAAPLQKLQESGRVLFETTLVRKDGQPVPVEASVRILELHGRRVALSVVRDVTEHKRIEGLSSGRKGRWEQQTRAQTEEWREVIDRLQDEVARRVLAEGKLHKLALELSETQDRERRRLAEILHDDLQQTLAAAKFQLSLLSDRVREDQELAEIAGQVKQMLKEAIEKSRSLSHELGPPVPAQNRLDDTFEWLARQMESQHGLVVHVQTRGRTDGGSQPVRAFLYKAAREILFNVVKHAHVSEAHLRLQRVRDQWRLTISDKGRGFDLAALIETAGFGLLSVRERVQVLGGRMRIRSALGKGSTFVIAVPDTSEPSERA